MMLALFCAVGKSCAPRPGRRRSTHGAELVRAVRNLGDDLGKPLAVRLVRRYKVARDEAADGVPVLGGAKREVGDDIHLASLRQSRSVAERARLDIDDALDDAVLVHRVAARLTLLGPGGP
jgi:hypothetical protein